MIKSLSKLSKSSHIQVVTLLFSSFFFLFTSCTLQQKVAKQYTIYNDSVAILILPPQILQKSNIAIQRLYPQYAQLSPMLQDTIWANQTKLLDVVSDSIVVRNYYNNLTETIKKSGMKIYNYNQIDDFNKTSYKKWVIRIGQFQLEEDKQKVDFSKEINGQEELYKDLEITVLSVNSWIEVYKNLSDTIPVKVLYGQKTTSDNIDGRFFSTGNGDQYEFCYVRKDIKAEDVTKLANEAGLQNAQQLTNFFFNKYIRIQYPDSETYFGYDLNDKSFYYPESNTQLIEIK
ncbi:MAG: hypothetical protein WCP69_13710 [Bacteroidota bacterium]